MRTHEMWDRAFQLVLDGAESATEDYLGEDIDVTEEELEYIVRGAGQILEFLHNNRFEILFRTETEVVWKS